MDIIFGTTNNRKKEDLQSIIYKMDLDIRVLSMDDIGWDRGEIEENGKTIEENSLIKAQAILSFCRDHNLEYPVLTDDAGLFVDALNGEPGIRTARYAKDEIGDRSNVKKAQNIRALLNYLENLKK